MIQFYAPDILETKTLPESDSGHCIRVLRMTSGDRVEVVDGKGMRYVCVIVTPNPKHTVVEIESAEKLDPYWPQNLTLAVAPTKMMDRMEWMVEKLTELGVNRIIPLLCSRSERKEIKTERLVKIAVAAMKQSLQATLPQIDAMTRFDDVARGFGGFERFIAYCDESLPRVELCRSYIPRRDSIIMIGPEGDFAPSEISDALQCGWQPVSLGENRLRTETAALAALQTCHVVDELSGK